MIPLRLGFTLFLGLFLPHGCSTSGAEHPKPLQHKAANGSPEVIALYEAWFGHPQHISVGYSSHDTGMLASQMRKAKSLGISGFVVDWYGDREPFIDQSYALMQTTAGKNDFKIAMMYDETDQEDGATDAAIADLTMFHDTYLSSKSAGHQSYLSYQGRPVIFIFPKGNHTDWARVRKVTDTWSPAPLLIQENVPGKDGDAFDGFYAWIGPGPKGWAADGSNWGEPYLTDFYQTMNQKHPDKIMVAGAWAKFDDSKAHWGLNRRIDARCGQTFKDTYNEWRKYLLPGEAPPFVMIETWNDYEEGTAIEPGLPSCGAPAPLTVAAAAQENNASSSQPATKN